MSGLSARVTLRARVAGPGENAQPGRPCKRAPRRRLSLRAPTAGSAVTPQAGANAGSPTPRAMGRAAGAVDPGPRVPGRPMLGNRCLAAVPTWRATKNRRLGERCRREPAGGRRRRRASPADGEPKTSASRGPRSTPSFSAPETPPRADAQRTSVRLRRGTTETPEGS